MMLKSVDGFLKFFPSANKKINDSLSSLEETVENLKKNSEEISRDSFKFLKDNVIAQFRNNVKGTKPAVMKKIVSEFSELLTNSKLSVPDYVNSLPLVTAVKIELTVNRSCQALGDRVIIHRSDNTARLNYISSFDNVRFGILGYRDTILYLAQVELDDELASCSNLFELGYFIPSPQEYHQAFLDEHFFSLMIPDIKKIIK